MYASVIRHSDLFDRQQRGLSQYYFKRSLGVRCPDLLSKEEREHFERSRASQLHRAYSFVARLHS